MITDLPQGPFSEKCRARTYDCMISTLYKVSGPANDLKISLTYRSIHGKRSSTTPCATFTHFLTVLVVKSLR